MYVAKLAQGHSGSARMGSQCCQLYVSTREHHSPFLEGRNLRNWMTLTQSTGASRLVPKPQTLSKPSLLRKQTEWHVYFSKDLREVLFLTRRQKRSHSGLGCVWNRRWGNYRADKENVSASCPRWQGNGTWRAETRPRVGLRKGWKTLSSYLWALKSEQHHSSITKQ